MSAESGNAHADVNASLEYMDNLLDPSRELLAIPYSSATAKACRSDMAKIRHHIDCLEHQRAALVDRVTALVEALKGMRDKLYSVAERHNDRSCDYDVCKEVRDCDAALRAAGVVL